MAKKKPSFGKFFLKLLVGIPTLLTIARKIFALIKIEARESCRSLVKILILGIFFLIVLSSTWISALAILFVYLIQWQLSIPAALGIIILVNLLSLLIILFHIFKSKKKLCFPETQRQLRNL